MLTTRTTIRVRYAETDQMGFAWHGHYLAWFETARVDMLDQVGLPYVDLEKQGYFLPVFGATIDYRKAARFHDVITVVTTIDSLPRAKLTVAYRIERGEELLATGQTQHAFMSPEGKLLRPPERFLTMLETYIPPTA